MILLFLLETRSNNRSDWIYVKSTLDYFYENRKCRYDALFCKSKDELIKQDKAIKRKITEYTKYTNNEYKVLLVADYDRKEEKNKNIADYCNKNKYELIWMNPNIEKVYLNKDIKSGDKKREAEKFAKNKNSIFPHLNNLEYTEPLKEKCGSNIIIVVDKYLIRKNKKQ